MADPLDEIDHRLSTADTVRPPKSDRPGKHWTPAGVLMVLGGIGALLTTFSVTVGPLVVAALKPDLSGYVQRHEFEAEKRRADDMEKELSRARRKAGEAWLICDDLRSQFNALDERQDSVETPKKKRR